MRAYNPNQPRVPAGNPDGGQWTDGGFHLLKPRHDAARRDDEGALRVAGGADDDPSTYRVDLREEEAPNGIGHTIRAHVGRSDADLLADVRLARFVAPPGKKVRGFRVGSFASVESANDFVNGTLDGNRSEIDAFLNSAYDSLTIWRRFGYATGREAVRDENGPPPYMRNTYGVKAVLFRDPRAGRGYRVRTAFPANE